MSDTAKWYVLHTYSGYENKVADDILKTVENRKLQDIIVDAKVPTETVVEVNDNKKREVERKTYPGYVFVKMLMRDDSWYVVRNIRGVTGFVGPSSKPVPLTDDEVINTGIEERSAKQQIEVNFAVGDTVNVNGGPLQGFVGTVDSIDLDKGKVKVIVSMFGRETPVEIELEYAEPVK